LLLPLGAAALLEASSQLASKQATSLEECTPLLYALASGDAECLLVLSEAGIDVAALLGEEAHVAVERMHGAEAAAEVEAALRKP